MSADLVGQIMAYEDGELDTQESLALFGALVASGMVWSLQGAYGRTAASLIEGGYLNADGSLTDAGRDLE